MRKRILLPLCFLAIVTAQFIVSARAQSAGKQEYESSSVYYKKWLDQDVLYIITDDERAVFQKLTTDEERDRFIEQFWLRRDPDPSTPHNEFKEEHYRRIQYANERFAAGIPGWKTDRGWVYIRFGQPDHITSYPAGGSYERKANEGGGWTSVYPFEVWEYRYIEGVGDDIELEFVNTAGGNLYHLTMDPQEKDEFLHVPGMGLTNAELFNPDFEGRKSFDRVVGIRENGLALNQGIEFERAKDQPFEKAELLMKIAKAAPIRFNDLKEKVTARVLYRDLPFGVSSSFIRIDSDTFMVPVTLSFDSRDVAFRSEYGIRRSELQVYGLVTTLAGRKVYEFDDEIVSEHADGESTAPPQEQTYQRKIAVPPGRYKLDLMVKDAVSGKMGTAALGIELPASHNDQLCTSSIILTKEIAPAVEDPSRPFVFGVYKVRPQVDGVFGAGDNLGFYLEIYNFRLDQSTGKPALQIQYGFAPPREEPADYRPILRGATLAGDRIQITRVLQPDRMEAGPQDLVVTVFDRLSGQSATARARFEVR